MDSVKKTIKEILKKTLYVFRLLGYDVLISKRRPKIYINQRYPADMTENFEILREVQGWLDIEGLQIFHFLSRILNCREPIIEIGVFCGRSLLALGCAFKNSQIVGVDPFFDDFYNSPAFHDEAKHLSRGAGGLTRKERIEIIYKTAEILDKKNNTNLKNRLKLEEKTQKQFLDSRDKFQKYRMIYIDGEHTFEAITEIINSFDSLLYESSFVVVDDILNPGFPGIAEAVFRHPIFKKNLFPVFYGFNKGVFIFRPESDDFIKCVTDSFKSLYANDSYDTRILHDKSIEIGEKY